MFTRWLSTGFLIHCSVLACGAAGSMVFLWWRADWPATLAAAIATTCVSLPIYGWHQWNAERRQAEETNATLRAGRIAGNAWLKLMREQDTEALKLQREGDMAVVAQLLARNEAIAREAQRLTAELARHTDRPRAKNGRWVKRDKTLQIAGPAKAKREVLPLSVMTIEGEAIEGEAIEGVQRSRS